MQVDYISDILLTKQIPIVKAVHQEWFNHNSALQQTGPRMAVEKDSLYTHIHNDSGIKELLPSIPYLERVNKITLIFILMNFKSVS